MSTITKSSFVTFDDFCELVEDGQKADLIDGVLYMASPDNTAANDLNMWLCALMRIYSQQRELGKVFASRVAFRLDDKNGPEPDIGFLRKEHLHRVRRGRVDGPPDLVVEIVSPDSSDRDYGKKRDQYERFGVEEYWIVDEVEERITLLHLEPDGRYREILPEDGVLNSRVLPGFALRPEWFWQDPRPSEWELLHGMLK